MGTNPLGKMARPHQMLGQDTPIKICLKGYLEDNISIELPEVMKLSYELIRYLERHFNGRLQWMKPSLTYFPLEISKFSIPFLPFANKMTPSANHITQNSG